ncbi:MAG: hypothetical protein LBT85_00225 [Bifidobacteriaceae bacterium]|jgi:hypothetical protein|nr:hypothetical protein [Bifidobacteriaceae bacterium]
MRLIKRFEILTRERDQKESLPQINPNLAKLFCVVTTLWILAFIVSKILVDKNICSDVFFKISLCGVFIGIILLVWERINHKKLNKK